VLLALLGPAFALAQRQLFHEYGSADGLSNLNVKCLLQDRTGYIWVGTDNGLFRYDGGKFHGYGHADGLPNTEVLSLAESPDGVLWVGTNDGVALLEGERFKPLEVGEQSPSRYIGFDAAGNVYLEQDSGILRGISVDRRSYRFHLVVAGSVTGLLVNGGEILFGRDGGLWSLRGDTAERFQGSFGLPTDQWRAITQDSLGNKWIRSRTRLYELPRGQTRFLNRSSGIPHVADPALNADHHGRVFVSTSSGTIVLAGNGRTLFDARHGLPADPSGPMLIDREELLWMGTDGAGLIRRLGHGEWLAWNEDDGLLRNSVWAIENDRAGNIWVGTNGGLSVLDRSGKLSRSWTRRDGLAGDRVLSMAVGPAGDFFVGTDAAGISHFSAQGKLLHSYGTESGYLAERVSSMAFDRDGRLWAVGTGGCFRSREPALSNRIIFERMEIPGMPANTFFRDVLIDHSGVVWVASSRGLARFDGVQWRMITARDGLKSSDLGVIAEAQGALWIGYRDALGMTRIEGPEPKLSHFNVQDGLHSDQVYAITSDHKGRLWVSTDMGMDVLDTGKWKHYGTEDGLIWDDTDSLALHVDGDDNVWIGTSAGLSKFAQPEFPIKDEPPPIVLTSIAGTSEKWQPGDSPVLHYSERSLSIQYAALAYEFQSSTRFRYRLAGFDQNWTETTDRGVHFAALPPGRYVFEVTAAGSNGIWNPSLARFSFSINSPWWWTWWFISSSILTALLIVFGFLQVRIRVLEAQKRALAQQVADRTEELMRSHRQLEEIAYCDMLTNLPNRRMFVEKMRMSLARTGPAEPFTLLLIDLDFFKSVNDSYGHDAGDAVLVETARRIRSEVRQSDCLGRLGGDEFAVLLFSELDVNATESLCKRILDVISDPIMYKNHRLRVGCSIGLARYPVEGDTQESLYKSADQALYKAKQSGRNAFCWHNPFQFLEDLVP
jgi:diguanylate cyclase (GGDEF)-like protein